MVSWSLGPDAWSLITCVWHVAHWNSTPETWHLRNWSLRFNLPHPLKLSFSHKKLFSKFHYSIFFISADSCEAYKFRDLRKLPTLMQPELFQFLSRLSTYLWDTHNLKIFHEVHGSSHFHGVGKKFLHKSSCPFSKMKALLWHQYQGIHRYENMCCSIYVYIYKYMYLSILL